MTALAVLAALLAVLLAIPPRARWPTDGSGVATLAEGPTGRPRPAWWRGLLAALAGCAATLFLDGPLGVLAGPVAAGAASAAWGTGAASAAQAAKPGRTATKASKAARHSSRFVMSRTSTFRIAPFAKLNTIHHLLL